jgi:hypothetical protein
MAENPEVLRGTKQALKMVRDIKRHYFEQGGTPR